MLFLFVFGCDDKSQKDTGENKSCPKLVFRFATEVKPDNKVWEAARLIKEALEKTSPDGVIKDGEIKVQFYDQGMLLPVVTTDSTYSEPYLPHSPHPPNIVNHKSTHLCT